VRDARSRNRQGLRMEDCSPRFGDKLGYTISCRSRDSNPDER
jgi:hypothetical protein